MGDQVGQGTATTCDVILMVPSHLTSLHAHVITLLAIIKGPSLPKSWAYSTVSKENVPHPCSEGNITFQTFSAGSAFPRQKMMNSDHVFGN